MAQDKPAQPLPSAEQIAAMKAKLIADPNTKKIAESVKLPLEQYIELVMKYAANPNIDPTVYVAEDEDLKAAGFEPVDFEKLVNYVVEHSEAQEISTKSKFADPNSARERVTGKIPVPPPATARPEE